MRYVLVDSTNKDMLELHGGKVLYRSRPTQFLEVDNFEKGFNTSTIKEELTLSNNGDKFVRIFTRNSMYLFKEV